jgi:hypothetical protein
MNSSAPSVIPRPKLAIWMFLRGLSPKDGATALGVGPETVRRYCLPFGAPLRVVPRDPVMSKIVAWTDGSVEPGDFYEPELTGRRGEVTAVDGPT